VQACASLDVDSGLGCSCSGLGSVFRGWLDLELGVQLLSSRQLLEAGTREVWVRWPVRGMHLRHLTLLDCCRGSLERRRDQSVRHVDIEMDQLEFSLRTLSLCVSGLRMAMLSKKGSNLWCWLVQSQTALFLFSTPGSSWG
jgi:hypothetical protein